jgi:S-adenosylmethionine synthetase
MRLFTTEQVSKYHPDKYADQISDAILDAYLAKDRSARVAVETLVKDDTVVVAGEVTSFADVVVEDVVRRVAKKLKYQVGSIINLIGTQSKEIASAVEKNAELNAGDQGFMVGYATRETKNYLPFGFDLANRIIKIIEKDAGKRSSLLKGDAKTQVTVDLDKKPNMESVHTIIISVCHQESYKGKKVTVEYLRDYLLLLLSVDHLRLNTNQIHFIVNPGGVWTVGGPFADCGVTGRKIVCDQYGGYVPVGGGAFSGKDPSKMDRTGAYAARKLAIKILQTFTYLQWVEVQIAYCMGMDKPISLYIKTDQPKRDERIATYFSMNQFTPSNIINSLLLYQTDYEKVAEGCHYYGTNW